VSRACEKPTHGISRRMRVADPLQAFEEGNRSECRAIVKPHNYPTSFIPLRPFRYNG
jgi:hypothetical protein